jgi:coatomer subunit beta'
VWRFDLAKECFEKAGDLSALMLLLMAMGDRDGLKLLAGESWCVVLFLLFFLLLMC